MKPYRSEKYNPYFKKIRLCLSCREKTGVVWARWGEEDCPLCGTHPLRNEPEDWGVKVTASFVDYIYK